MPRSFTTQQIAAHIAPSVMQAAELAELCRPLFRASGLNYFGYSCFVTQSSEWFGLYTNPELPRQALEAGHAPPFVRDGRVVLPQGSFYNEDLPAILASDDADELFKQMPEAAPTAYCSGFHIVRHHPDCAENFFFAAPEATPTMRQHYNELAATLHDFTHYFLDKGHALVRQARDGALPLRNYHGRESAYKHLEEVMRQRFAPSRYALTTRDGTVFLSPRELHCAQLYAQGLTQRDIAEEIGLSARTVESYLTRFRSKVGAKTRKSFVPYLKAFESA